MHTIVFPTRTLLPLLDHVTLHPALHPALKPKPYSEVEQDVVTFNVAVAVSSSARSKVKQMLVPSNNTEPVNQREIESMYRQSRKVERLMK